MELLLNDLIILRSVENEAVWREGSCMVVLGVSVGGAAVGGESRKMRSVAEGKRGRIGVVGVEAAMGRIITSYAAVVAGIARGRVVAV